MWQRRAAGSPFAIVPKYVQITVNFLRDVNPFKELIARQVATPSPAISLSDKQFDQWLQSNDSVILNSLPVAWNSSGGRNAPCRTRIRRRLRICSGVPAAGSRRRLSSAT